MLEESAETLNDYLIVFDRLHTMGKIKKKKVSQIV